MKLILPVDPNRQVRLSPHRFGQAGNLVILEDPNGDRYDLHLTDAQLRALYLATNRRLGGGDR